MTKDTIVITKYSSTSTNPIIMKGVKKFVLDQVKLKYFTNNQKI